MILILQEPARTKGKDTYSSSSLNYPKKVKELLNIQQIPNAYFFSALTTTITFSRLLPMKKSTKHLPRESLGDSYNSAL